MKILTESPICFVIGGPNGAGKTTFANEFLPNEGKSEIFINADLIAAGLSPFNPDIEAITAGRLLIEQIERHAAKKEIFAFESTLSGTGHMQRIRTLKENGYLVIIFYVMLEDVEVSLNRIKDRVSQGGHNIPETDARRRFPKSILNFLNLYAPLADAWKIYDNTKNEKRLVAESSGNGIEIHDVGLYDKLKTYAK
jgi:predicted ABC-type ATPase